MRMGMYLFGWGGPKKESLYELWQGPKRTELIMGLEAGYYWVKMKVIEGYIGDPSWRIGYYDREFNSVWYTCNVDRDYEWEHIICVGPEIKMPAELANV